MLRFIWVLLLSFLPLQYAFIQHPATNGLRSIPTIQRLHHQLINLRAYQGYSNDHIKDSLNQIFDFKSNLREKKTKKIGEFKSLTVNFARFLMKGIFLSLAFTYDYQPESPFLSQRIAKADSTGKYSTKATAKKRYLPRLKKAVAEFKILGDSIENGEEFSLLSKSYQERIESSYGTALSLYGSSTRSGEYLDDQSREVQETLKNFISDSKSLTRITDKAKAKQVYDKMKEELQHFLILCKLEGDINAVYYTEETKPVL